MRWYSKVAAAALAALLQACATAPPLSPPPPAAAEAKPAVTILVSIDGFRADYLQRGVTPVLSRLAAEGATGVMRPSFPSKTFPNHWTLVTGLVPDHHGITANRIEDPARPQEVFTMATDDPWWWNAADPIWVDAEKAGIRSATMFWPGSNVPIGGTRAAEWPHDIEGGTRPEDWAQYNEAITGEQRVNGVLDWLRRPAAIRPRLVTLYFDTVDTAGHSYGPDDAKTTKAVAQVDRQIGLLVNGLAQLGQPANLVIVADHGMAATSSERTVVIPLAAEDYHLVESGPYLSLVPLPGKDAAVEKALLGHHDHYDCWRRQQIPARFRYGTNARIPPIFCLAETGWLVQDKPPKDGWHGGNHGYDNRAPEMAALFIANGPAFVPGTSLAPFDNVDVYPMLRDVLGLPPKAGVDGSDASLRPALKH